MGIDVYLRWPGQQDAEHKAQYTGFSTHAGNVGYLREAYHGGPYATAVLIAENWDQQPDDGFPIPAATLRKRLPAAVMTAIYREHKVYGEVEKDPAVLDGTDGLLEKLKHIFTVEVKNKEHEDMRFTDEQIRQCNALIEKRALSRVALAFVDFVILAERKEKETGEPCRVIVSA